MRLHASFVLVMALIAGCMGGPSKPSCSSDACGASTPVPSGTIGLPPITYPITVNQTAQFEDCAGGISTARVPADKVRAVVPDEFRVDASLGLIPGVASILVTALTCSRVAVKTTVLTDVSMLRITAFVTPRNDSWRGEGNDDYVLDTWFSAPELTAWFKPTRMPTETATFRKEATPSGSGPHTEAWTIDGPNCHVETGFRVSGQNQVATKGTYYHWIGPRPYERMEVFETSVQDVESDTGVVTVTGDCTSQAVFDGTPVSGTSSFPSFNATWTITGNRFG